VTDESEEEKLKTLSIPRIVSLVALAAVCSCAPGGSGTNPAPVNPQDPMSSDASIIYLHHSTGEGVWNGGVSAWFDAYNSGHDKEYLIEERSYPDGTNYPWDNYPYDYWNIWINHAGATAYSGQDTLEILTAAYDVIMWKHCYPVSDIAPDTGSPDIASAGKSLENYKLQYNALKTKMRSFPNNRFVVWTGAALIESETNPEAAARAREFFTWVKDEWDESGDNIFVWDFYELETEGTNYLLYSSGDSHPSAAFNQRVAPFISQRIVDVIEGRGDTGSLTGE